MRAVLYATLVALSCASASLAQDPRLAQSAEQVAQRDQGCVSCHAGIEEMHDVPGASLACVDCHGAGEDALVVKPAGAEPGSEAFEEAKRKAHVQPANPERWWSATRTPAANPERSYTAWLDESVKFVQFVNPGDLRVADQVCGGCHPEQTAAVARHPMTTSAIFWAAAAYANGILPSKRALFGESYGPDGKPRIIRASPTPEQVERGALSELLPLPRWEIIQPGEYFRAFERGGILNLSTPPEIGNPNVLDDPGRPDIRVSNRGRGTGARISPALINIHKTRLNDPHLSLLGTNDQPGDYRSSGCTACHVVYANDRDPLHSGGWAQFGHMGQTVTLDPSIDKDESGHPIVHRLTRSVPTSQCMSCHMHQPNAFLNTYLGYTMWDYVTDGRLLWDAERQRYPTEAQKRAILERNPEGAAVRGKWGDVAFLATTSELESEGRQTQFADYHGHGWVFQAVYKRDRKGQLLDAAGRVVPFDDPERLAKAVHLKDIHLEKGMHCVDCHFSRDNHGDGQIYGEYGDAIELRCEDCHGTVERYTELLTTGPAAPAGGTDLSLGTTPFGQRRFQWQPTADGRKLMQRSMLTEGLEWKVKQVRDTVTVGHADYRAASERAKTLRTDGKTIGLAGLESGALAHRQERMACYSCHTSWMTSCSGCHLPQEANVRSEMQHYEGTTTRNFASYNPQVIRTDMFILGLDSSNKGNKIAPVRSSSALVLSSTNQSRQRIYTQQPPISTPGFSSQAFNPHVPHTVRSVETRQCSDCHVSQDNDNNAWMGAVLGLGTNFPNFIGHHAWVGLEEGFEAVTVTEWEEPQPVIGSWVHSLAFPDWFREHREREAELVDSHGHHGGEVRSIQLRGEFLFTAQGKAGMRVYDVANVGNKDFSERIVSAPVSPAGQRTAVDTRDATAVALPTTMPVAPWRCVSQRNPQNEEQPMHPIYRYAFVSDREEGLVVVNVDTLTDGIPTNNFLRRTKIEGKSSYNPQGLLDGASTVAVGGNHVYVGSRKGLVILDFADYEEVDGACEGRLDPKRPLDHRPEPTLRPRVAAVLDEIVEPTSIEVQFRYLFVTDAQGLAVVDVTDKAVPRLVARVPIADARKVYVARTYAYVAAGKEGLVIVDVERPEAPTLDRSFDAGGKIDDACDVKVGSTQSTLFAYIADGKNGLRVVELTSPDTVPGYLGFSPRPEPRLIATKHTHGRALALSKGLDRDRAVDESGNQVSVFNRIGARPFNAAEMERLYLKDGRLYTVEDGPEPGAQPGQAAVPSEAGREQARGDP
jgi:hypothetical protein